MRELLDKTTLMHKNDNITDIKGSIANSIITTFISIKLISCFIALNAYFTGKFYFFFKKQFSKTTNFSQSFKINTKL